MARSVKVGPLGTARLIDVARAAKVARSTAAQALYGSGGSNVRVGAETAKRIRRLADEMNFRPDILARGLRGSSTRSIGAVWEFVDPWCGDTGIGNSILARLQARGLATYQANHPHTPEQTLDVLDDLLQRRVDALIIRWRHDQFDHPEIRARLERFPRTIAVVPWAVDGLFIDQIIHDRDDAIRDVVDHFARTGRQRPAIVVHAADLSDRRKLEVFRDRCRERGLADHAKLCVDLGHVRMPRVPHYEQALAEAFAGEVDVDAILCVNDVGAMTTARFLRRRGVRIPEQVALCGLNDPEAMALFDPPLASIGRAQERVVDAVCEMLDRRMADNELPPQRQVVPMRFVWRESAG